ncbi:MAG: ribosomal RNA small subunit methyltransferase A [candidate division Zixibacteria bacterium]|nr:ribosomal RNA small subunit methyltransferase A [candidate division Zixibacteria bacterium]
MVRAKKSLGQHFLSDPIIVSEIISAVAPEKGETIMEIGPGEGVLTIPLVNSEANIFAIELDRRLAPRLAREFAARDNFTVLEADILAIDPKKLGLDNFAVVGNLPYNITTPIMDWLLSYHESIDRAVFMMQKEVGQRVTSPPGRKSYSTISVLTSLYYDSSVVCDVPPESFTPPPKVDSVVVKFIRHSRNYDIDNMNRFEKFVRFCFAGKRKNLTNNLNSAYPIPKDEIQEIIGEVTGNPKIRGEQLELQTFIDLSKAIFNKLS